MDGDDFIATAYDANGNVLKCSYCNKPSIGGALGERCQVLWCEDHSLLKKEDCTFICNQKPSIVNRIIVNDSWVVDLRTKD